MISLGSNVRLPFLFDTLTTCTLTMLDEDEAALVKHAVAEEVEATVEAIDKAELLPLEPLP